MTVRVAREVAATAHANGAGSKGPRWTGSAAAPACAGVIIRDAAVATNVGASVADGLAATHRTGRPSTDGSRARTVAAAAMPGIARSVHARHAAAGGRHRRTAVGAHTHGSPITGHERADGSGIRANSTTAATVRCSRKVGLAAVRGVRVAVAPVGEAGPVEHATAPFAAGPSGRDPKKAIAREAAGPAVRGVSAEVKTASITAGRSRGAIRVRGIGRGSNVGRSALVHPVGSGGCSVPHIHAWDGIPNSNGLVGGGRVLCWRTVRNGRRVEGTSLLRGVGPGAGRSAGLGPTPLEEGKE